MCCAKCDASSLSVIETNRRLLLLLLSRERLRVTSVASCDVCVISSVLACFSV